MDIQSLIENTERDVQAAAAALDETMPGWHGRVDMDRINMEDSDLCIAGQLDLWGIVDTPLRRERRLAFIWPDEVWTDEATLLLWVATATVAWWDEVSKRTGEPAPHERPAPEGFLPEHIRTLLVTV